ncbi:mtDNA inheritance, partitioning of the mitochondrial organelle [Ascosphaera aggregata]|nr:mtDNA inheritance, partitioning of the mitochondrial organelle [Ascosphaera aggregata]
MHEIVTLQLGQRSNYLATHFWNIQESYFTYTEKEESPVDHDVHFRTGVGADGSETYTPRTVIYDLKGGFGTLRKYNALYEMEDGVAVADGLWTGNKIVQKQPAIPRIEYQQNLDLGLPAPALTAQSVRYWSDFNRVFYHPRSIVQLNSYELHSQIAPFDSWTAGEELFKEIDSEEDILDRDFRPFVEECDQLNGIQVFAGIDDAWGGFTARYIDSLRDEFGKTGIWVWGTQDDAVYEARKRIALSLNKARSIAELSLQTNAYIPLSVNHQLLPAYCNLCPSSEWYSSALLASAVECVTLPTRLKQYGDLGRGNWIPGDNREHNIYELQALATLEDIGLPENQIDHEDGEILRLDDYEQDEALMEGFEMNLSPLTQGEGGHVFGQTRVSRVSDTGGKIPYIVRLKSGTALQRDLFVFENSSTALQNLEVRTALSSTTRTRGYVNDLRILVSKAMPIDEREAIMNDLGDISDHHSYHRGSDDGSDDD